MVIGIGAGDPDYITLQAIEAIKRCTVFLIPQKGEAKSDLSQLRLEILARTRREGSYRLVHFDMPKRRAAGDDYLGAVDEWHEAIADAYQHALEQQVGPQEVAGLLVWGDPSLYDSTLRILERLNGRTNVHLEYDVIPGITAVQALAARHRVALNDIGEPVLTTTGRKLARNPDVAEGSVVVMLDGELAFKAADQDMFIYWGAYLGTPDEILISGRLADVAADIERLRADARDRRGWIMDTYLIKRTP
jgi:precorrin-6A synthase